MFAHRRVPLLLTVIGTCLFSGVASAGAMAGAAAPNPGVLRPFAPEYMDRNGPRTEAEAVRDARHFDVIDAKEKTYTPYVAAMRRANPRLRLLAYMDATMTPGSASYPASWYLHDANGDYVKTLLWGQNTMDPANPGWIRSRQETCRSLLISSHYDGCLLDVIGPSVVNNSGFTTGVPINPRTGKPYTSNQWMHDTGAIADAVRSYVPAGTLIYGNNIGDGTAYYDPAAPTSRLVSHYDGVQTEGFLRPGRGPLPGSYPDESTFLLNLREVADVAARGKQMLVITKTWNTGTAAEKKAWQRFSAASFLLVADGSQRFSFLPDEALTPATYYPWYDAPIGSPTGAYRHAASGVYRRDFATGRVFVNPTASSITVTVEPGFVDVTNGASAGGTVVIAPHSGLILRR